MARMVFYTQSYNNEKTITSTMESVLAQTMEDFVYYVADDCSTDGTVAAIRKVAEKDSRVRVIEREENGYMKTHRHALATIMEEHPEALYFSQLDGDDWHHEDFAAYCVDKMDQGADLAMCSIDYVRANAQCGFDSVWQRAWPLEDGFLTPGQIIERFMLLHVHFRTIWGKVYRLDIIREQFIQHPDMIIAGDTIFVYTYLRHVQKLHITGKYLHIYRSHDASQSFRYDPIRHRSIGQMKQVQLETLGLLKNTMEKNVTFISITTLNDIQDAMDIDVKQLAAKKPLSEPFENVMKDPVLTEGWALLNDASAMNLMYGYNKKPLGMQMARSRMKLYTQAKDLFAAGLREESRQVLEFLEPAMATFWAGERPGAIFSSPLFQLWLLKGTEETWPQVQKQPKASYVDYALHAYLAIGRKDFLPAAEYLKKYPDKMAAAQRDYIVAHHPILGRMEGGREMLAHNKPLQMLFAGQYKELLDYLPQRIPELAEKKPEDALLFCRLGQIIAALMEEGGHYVFFQKAELELLLLTGKMEAFLPLWEQLDEMLPGDEELALLHKAYLEQAASE